MPSYAKWLIAVSAVFTLLLVGLGAFFFGWVLAPRTAGAPVLGYRSNGPAQMGGWGVCGGPAGSCPIWGEDGGLSLPPAGQALTMEEAYAAVERYAAAWGNPDLVVHEVMEFDQNFYAIVEEESTGIGAFEVLVDKWTGAVGPEPGPNMMWNARYGMMGGRGMMGGGGMMGGYWTDGTRMRVSPEQAAQIAQEWLDRNLPGVEARADDVDPFYGYYTLHVWDDGQVYGMLSVHGETGQVWYHNWHGGFVAMLEQEGH